MQHPLPRRPRRFTKENRFDDTVIEWRFEAMPRAHRSPNGSRVRKLRAVHLILRPSLPFSARRLRSGSCLREIRRLPRRKPSRVRTPSPGTLFRQCGPVKFGQSALKRLRRLDFLLARQHSGHSRDQRCAGARSDPKLGVNTRNNISEVRCRRSKRH